MESMKRTIYALALAAWLGSGAAPLFSQAGFSSTYDASRQVKLQGAVTRIDWVTPEAFIFVDVQETSGATTNWAIDLGNPVELERGGWNRNTVRIGDVVAIDGVPARSASSQASARSVVLTRTGRRVFAPPTARRPAAAAPAPRWPDGQMRLGPPAGRTGYWGAPSAAVLFDNKAGKIPMTDDGLLLNVADADKVAPFLPWAKALYEHRQRTYLQDDPSARCMPAGGPRQFQMPNGFQFIEQRELGRILVFLGGGNRNWRIIYTDGRQLGTAAEAVPTYYGTSVGRWEKDTLVVESVGYNEKFWMTNGGLPHTDTAHFTERFTRTDLNTMRYEVTVNDPRAYARPWTGGWTVQWVADQEMPEFFCEDKADFIR
jgi:hypothetical protein